jgi:hypothetical protein
MQSTQFLYEGDYTAANRRNRGAILDMLVQGIVLPSGFLTSGLQGCMCRLVGGTAIMPRTSTPIATDERRVGYETVAQVGSERCSSLVRLENRHASINMHTVEQKDLQAAALFCRTVHLAQLLDHCSRRVPMQPFLYTLCRHYHFDGALH